VDGISRRRAGYHLVIGVHQPADDVTGLVGLG
jgi:hypothetical protein